MKSIALIEAILHMMGVRVPHEKHCHHFKRAAQIAPIVLDELARAKSDLRPTLVSAMIGKESSWRWRREGDATYRKDKGVLVGEHGEIGWAQIKPDGRATEFCVGIDFHKPAGNIACAIRLLEAARTKCGGEPIDWLGQYHGDPCGPSDYAGRVLAIEKLGAPELIFTDVLP